MGNNLTFPFGCDTRFTLIPKLGDTVLTEPDMVGLTVEIGNRNMGILFVPIWKWTDKGIEIEIQRNNIPVASTYSVILDWRKPDTAYSDGFKDIMNACAQITFTTSCAAMSDRTAIIQMGLNYAVINIVDELPEVGNPGEFYAILEDA